ncbi:MAG: hypothetical protein M1272_03530 [Firmicutes bacterium]|nr:hypothetical protein [Bacillota bacterium]
MTQATKTWVGGGVALVAGLGLAFGMLAEGGAVKAATVPSPVATPIASAQTSAIRLPSVADQVENAGLTAQQAVGGGRVVAVSRVQGAASTWVVTVRHAGVSTNVWVNDKTNSVLKTANGVPSAVAIR